MELSNLTEESNLLRANHVMVTEEVDDKEHLHSTPRVLRLPIRAASSTPNQESFISSKLSHNASTQTNFTLNARDVSDFNNDIKSFFVDVTDDGVENMLSPNQTSYFNMNTTSPQFRCSKNPISCEKTPNRNKISINRKLSLRSKTMICSAIEKTKDRPNILMRYKSAEEKRLFSNTFSILPQPKTPPSSSTTIFHNPFEADLPERLGKSMFSPDVFDNVISPSEDSEYLRWTIEDISSINPVPINEDFSLPSDDEDPEKEFQVQQEIDRYFSETHYILSPYDIPKSCCNNEAKENKFYSKAVSSTPQKVYAKIILEFKNACTQTDLTLPEVLSEKLEESLKSYFRVFEIEELNLSASNLRRKLFFHSEDEPPSPVRFENHSSPVHSSPVTKDLRNIEQSPFDVFREKRHFTPLAHQQEFSSPEMSPVVPELMTVKSKTTNTSLLCKKTLHLFFPGDTVPFEEVKDESHLGPLVNSTVIMTSAVDVENDRDMTVDYSSVALPSSQDTGYHTEESWRQNHLLATPHKLHLPSSVMASTPTRQVD